jgi:hypothetical protein
MCSLLVIKCRECAVCWEGCEENAQFVVKYVQRMWFVGKDLKRTCSWEGRAENAQFVVK